MRRDVTKKVIKKVAKKLTKKILKSNAAFEKMDPAQKRVQIAKDVIVSLEAQNLIPSPGTYLATDLKQLMGRKKDTTELRGLLAKLPSCNVCARGAIAVCAVKRFNKLNCGQMKKAITRRHKQDQGARTIDEATFVNVVEDRYFDKAQVLLIERAFEGPSPRCRLEKQWEDFTDDERHNIIAFRVKFFDPHKDYGQLMAAIMQNVVDNGGTFKPETSLVEA